MNKICFFYDNGSNFKLYFEVLCESCEIKHKPTSVKNPQANAIILMLCNTELDMADTVVVSVIEVFLTNAAWNIF